MDKDDKKINQSIDDNNSDDYQKILDEYAASIKPEDTKEDDSEDPNSTPQSEPTAKLEEVNLNNESEEQVKLKDINAPQLEAPDELALPHKIPTLPSETETLPTTQNSTPIVSETKPETEIKPEIKTEPKLESQPLTSTVPETKTETQPVPTAPQNNSETPKTPEEIKAQIDKILADDSSPSTPPKKSSGLKGIFIFSLIIFFIIAGLWIYFLFFYQSSTNTSNSSMVKPTVTPSVATCELNGETYQIGESFKSADGCNTCSCQSADTIVCTEMACDADSSTSTSSATKSATKITITPTSSTKTTFQKMVTNWNLYKDITSTERTEFNGTGEWMSSVKSTDTLYSFVQKILKGSFKKLTISKENLKTITGEYSYVFYITPNYEKWSNEEFQKIDFNKYMTGIDQMAPLYAYSDKLVWKEFSCGGVISTSSNECQSLIKELNTAFP